MKSNLYQLIYCSRPFGFDNSVLNSLLIDSREANLLNNLTGALICRSDLYLQLLEGPEEKVLETFSRIKRDDRHVEVNILRKTQSSERLFPNWAMKDDPVHSWMWSRDEVARGVVLKASQQEILDVFCKIAIKKIY